MPMMSDKASDEAIRSQTKRMEVMDMKEGKLWMKKTVLLK